MNDNEVKGFAEEGDIIGSQEKWVLSIIKEAMVVLYKLSDDMELKSAIRTGKMMATEDRDTELIYMLSALYREEMSGNLKPPPSLKRLYRQVAEEYEQKQN